MNLHHQVKLTVSLLASILIISSGCEKGEYYEPGPITGLLDINVTDAPIDNPEIIGAFVTLAGIKINGDSNLLENRVTIDLLAYQEGNSKNLGTYDVEIGTHDEIELILDLQQDAHGLTPGCYIATRDGLKHNIAISTMLQKSLFIKTNSLIIKEGVTSHLVLDFDLRKAIKLDTGQVSVKYQMVSDIQLQQAIRAIDMDRTGSIMGKLDYKQSPDESVIVLAYKTGYFQERSETVGAGLDGITFANASNSSAVRSNGNFTLAFLPRGDYELIFVSYKDSDDDGILELEGLLNVTTSGGFKPDDINVEANNSVNLQLKSEELLPS